MGRKSAAEKPGDCASPVPQRKLRTRQGKRFIGKATLTLKGTTLTVIMKLHGADPGKYVLHVHRGDNCDFVQQFDEFKVDASGDGEGSGSIDVSGQGRSFFAEASGAGHSNDTLIVNL